MNLLNTLAIVINLMSGLVLFLDVIGQRRLNYAGGFLAQYLGKEVALTLFRETLTWWRITFDPTNNIELHGMRFGSFQNKSDVIVVEKVTPMFTQLTNSVFVISIVVFLPLTFFFAYLEPGLNVFTYIFILIFMSASFILFVYLFSSLFLSLLLMIVDFFRFVIFNLIAIPFSIFLKSSRLSKHIRNAAIILWVLSFSLSIYSFL